MKSRFAVAAALAFAVAQVAVAPVVYAEEAAAPFRTAAPQTFSSAELQAYGLDPAASDRAVALQEEGYQVAVLTPEEAEQMKAGISDSQWILLGILAGVVVIAFAVSD